MDAERWTTKKIIAHLNLIKRKNHNDSTFVKPYGFFHCCQTITCSSEIPKGKWRQGPSIEGRGCAWATSIRTSLKLMVKWFFFPHLLPFQGHVQIMHHCGLSCFLFRSLKCQAGTSQEGTGESTLTDTRTGLSRLQGKQGASQLAAVSLLRHFHLPWSWLLQSCCFNLGILGVRSTSRLATGQSTTFRYSRAKLKSQVARITLWISPKLMFLRKRWNGWVDLKHFLSCDQIYPLSEKSTKIILTPVEANYDHSGEYYNKTVVLKNSKL